MSSQLDESASSNGKGITESSSNESGSFECNICLKSAQDPIVTLCGHLFCWPCLYRWLHMYAHLPQCPVCEALVEESKVVPIYGQGRTNSTDPQTRSSIPSRPNGHRPGTSSQADTNPGMARLYSLMHQMNSNANQMTSNLNDMRSDMNEMSSKLADLRDRMDGMEERLYQIWYHTQRVHAWHIEQGHLRDEPIPPRQTRHQPPPPPPPPPAAPAATS